MTVNTFAGDSVERGDQLADYLGIFSRRRYIVIAGTVLAAVVALGYVVSSPPAFEAESPVLIEAPSEQATEAGLATLTTLLKRQDVRRETPSGETLPSVVLHPGATPDTLSARLALGDPTRAAASLNAMLGRALALYEEVQADSSQIKQKTLRRQLDAAATRMRALETGVRELRMRTAPLKAEHDAVLAAKSELVTLEAAIAGEESRLRAAEQELAAEKRATGLQGTRSNQAGGQSDVVNPAYQPFRTEIAVARVTLAALRAKRQKLADAARQSQEDFYSAEMQLDSREAELGAARETFFDLQGELQGVLDGDARARFSIVSPAVAPTAAKPSRAGFIVMIATVSGFMLAVVAALLIDYAATETIRARLE